MLAIAILQRPGTPIISSAYLAFSALSAASCLTLVFPSLLCSKQPFSHGRRRDRAYNMALVVARIDCQSSKTVKGMPSRSQYVMRSEGNQSSSGFAMHQIVSSPWPFLANNRSVSFAADRSDTPSPA